MSPATVGRRDEISRVERALTDVQGGGPGQLIELLGEAGVGKSTVFAAVVAHAEANGWRVFRAAPTAAEATFPWTGLAQLARGLLREAVTLDVQAHVAHIDAAISTNRTQPVEPELVAFGLTGLLDSIRAPAAPVLIAIDDYHWLDPASAGAIAYALRGTPNRRSVVLLSARSGEPLPFEPARVVDSGHHTVIDLAGLSLASLREIIASATGHTFGRGELAQLHQRTGGNPLYAIELARMVLDGVPLQAAALPESLRATLGRRVSSLPAETRRVLGAAALSVGPTVALLEAALPGSDVVAALGAAEADDVVRVRVTGADGRLVVFRHPLLAAAAIDSLTTGERRTIHAALATAVDDPVERAGHLLADLRPDEALAEQLETAARAAAARGAVDAAARYARASVAATPADSRSLATLERRHLHAERALYAGAFTDMVATLGTLRTDLPDPLPSGNDADAWHDLSERTWLLESLATIATRGMREGTAFAARALEHVHDPHRRYRLHNQQLRAIQHDNVRRAAEFAERVFGDGTEYTGWIALLGQAQLAMARIAAGEPVDVDALIARADDPDLSADQRENFLSQLVEPLVWSDHPRARELVELSMERQQRIGNRTAFLADSVQLAVHEFLRGEWARVEEMLLRLDEYSAEFIEVPQARADLAILRAAQGHGDAARSLLADVRALDATRTLEPTDRMWLATAESLVAHTLGDPEAADIALDAEALAFDLGVHCVRGLRFRRDLVEALVAAGRVDDAAAAADRLTADAERNQVPTALADADAARAVVEAATGDDDSARERFARAAAVQRQYDLRYELARTLLAAGSAARRRRNRTEARSHLDEARALFDAMGAVLWSQRCAQELDRLPGRRPISTGNELTPTERQVAELVVAGKTNAEIAAAMFVTVSTVESNLTRTYRKLGIRSRTELARELNSRNMG